MKPASDLSRAVLGFVWNVGLVAVVLAMIVAMSSRNWNDSNEESPDAGPRSIISASDGETTRAILEVGAGKPFSHYVLQDQEGNELLLVTYSRSGSLIVTLGQAFPIRPGYAARLDGIYNFEVSHGGFNYRLRIRPGETSGFSVAGPPDGVREGVSVTAAGEISHEPLAIE